METVKVTIGELYELRAQLDGFVLIKNNGEGKEPTKEVIYRGLLHEALVPETTKRGAYKALRVLNQEIEPIEKQRADIAKVDTSEGAASEEEQKKIAKQKDADLMADSVEFQVELIDFSKIESLSLSMNYNFLYDKLFKNA